VLHVHNSRRENFLDLETAIKRNHPIVSAITIVDPPNGQSVLSPYFVFRPHELIQITLRQTIELAKSIIHHTMRLYLKIWFQML
jgi:hypothetical protein